MANKKFSEFVLKTDTSDVSHIVGYNGAENVQITPANFIDTTGGPYLPLAGGTMVGTIVQNGGNIDFADGRSANFGDGDDLQIYHSGAGSYIKDIGTGNLDIQADNLNLLNAAGTEYYARFYTNGAAYLYNNGVAKFYTTGTGVEVIGNANFADNGKAIFGSPGNDLQIFHDGSNSYIQDAGTGRLILQTNYLEVQNAAGTEAILEGIEDGAVNLYFNSSKKFETTSTGISVTGDGLFTSSSQAQGIFQGWSSAGTNSLSGAIRLGGNNNFQGRIDYSADGNTQFMF
jgi:hypothetical protein